MEKMNFEDIKTLIKDNNTESVKVFMLPDEPIKVDIGSGKYEVDDVSKKDFCEFLDKL